MVMWVLHPGGYCYSSGQCVAVEVSGSRLLVDPGAADDIAMLREIGNEYAPDGRAFIVAPFWPGAYALLERRSPMWEIYALFPRSETFERREIDRVKAADPGFALVMDIPLDGREDLRFRNTHPLLYRHILDNFEPVSRELPPTLNLYKARSAKPKMVGEGLP